MSGRRWRSRWTALNSIKFYASSGVSARTGNNYDGYRRGVAIPLGRRIVMGSHVTDSHQPAYTAEEALDRLKEGNARFVSGHARFPTVQKEVLAELAKGQRPYATILGCSDSRVPPELVFDAAFGELFIIRVAGNVLGPSIAGTLQYAGTHLHTPLFVVLGHEGCGAVEAAIAEKFHGARHRSRIALLLREYRSRVGQSRPDAASRGAAQRGGRSERALDHSGTARIAGREGPPGAGRREADGRRV